VTNFATPPPSVEAGERHRVQGWHVVALTVVLALAWPLLGGATQGGFDALLGAGEEGPSRAAVERDIPDLAPMPGIGHDGQQFYVIARNPLDPSAAEAAVPAPSYRYRRILFPALGWLLAPGGGRQLIGAFLVLSLVGTAIGARSLQKLDGARPWLPLTMAVSPAVITSLMMSLSDAFGAGLALAAVAAAGHRRWFAALAMLVLAALTRESFLLVAAGLAFTPGMPPRWRTATVAVPTAVVGAWSLWCADAAGVSVLDGGPAQLALPLTGWASGSTDLNTFLLAGLCGTLLVAGAWRCRRYAPHVTVVLSLQFLLLISLSELVAFHWVNALRTATPLLPLALWALTLRDPTATPDAGGPPREADGAPSELTAASTRPRQRVGPAPLAAFPAGTRNDSPNL
jgi:hypothetical protein